MIRVFELVAGECEFTSLFGDGLGCFASDWNFLRFFVLIAEFCEGFEFAYFLVFHLIGGFEGSGEAMEEIVDI